MKNKKIFGIVIGVLLVTAVLVFGATQLKLSKVKPSDVEIVSVYQTDAKHFFVRYLIRKTVLRWMRTVRVIRSASRRRMVRRRSWRFPISGR